MIELKNISKSYGDTKVLSGLNCTIRDGLIYGLVGANGAGKSTLLRLINGIYLADEGEILIDGENPLNNSKVKQNIVFVPDDLFFYSGYTILDMAEFYKALYEKFDMEYLLKLAKMLKLDVHKKISNFSKGMKRQCALILAIATNAKYMFFDETFDGVDPVVRTVLKKILANHLEEKNSTIVLTSHNLRELEDIADNLGLLYAGGILFEGEIDAIKTNMFKVQISLKKDFDETTFQNIELLSFKKTGSVATLIVKGDIEEIGPKLEKMKPLILDYLPLTLEEIFIYEMEVLGYEFNECV